MGQFLKSCRQRVQPARERKDMVHNKNGCPSLRVYILSACNPNCQTWSCAAGGLDLCPALSPICFVSSPHLCSGFSFAEQECLLCAIVSWKLKFWLSSAGNMDLKFSDINGWRWTKCILHIKWSWIFENRRSWTLQFEYEMPSTSLCVESLSASGNSLWDGRNVMIWNLARRR